MLTIFLNRVFNAGFKGSVFYPFKKKALKNRLLLAGQVDETRELFNKGLVVFLPTHQSNLDSIMVGYMIDYKLGLPAFLMGQVLIFSIMKFPLISCLNLGHIKLTEERKIQFI